LIIAFFSILTFNSSAQEEIFEKIENKTWLDDNGSTGITIVFYKTHNGLLKSIRQINGSGVPVVTSAIYDIEIRNDTIYLLDGMNLKTSERIGELDYKFDFKTGLIIKKGGQLKIISEEPILFAWTDKRRNVLAQIDLKLLTEILIKKNEIYKDEDLIKTLIDK